MKYRKLLTIPGQYPDNSAQRGVLLVSEKQPAAVRGGVLEKRQGFFITLAIPWARLVLLHLCAFVHAVLTSRCVYSSRLEFKLKRTSTRKPSPTAGSHLLALVLPKHSDRITFCGRVGMPP